MAAHPPSCSLRCHFWRRCWLASPRGWRRRRAPPPPGRGADARRARPRNSSRNFSSSGARAKSTGEGYPTTVYSDAGVREWRVGERDVGEAVDFTYDDEQLALQEVARSAARARVRARRGAPAGRRRRGDHAGAVEHAGRARVDGPPGARGVRRQRGRPARNVRRARGDGPQAAARTRSSRRRSPPPSPPAPSARPSCSPTWPPAPAGAPWRWASRDTASPLRPCGPGRAARRPSGS